ncbi:MAG: four helix bundle protein [Bacteroidales bacterium]|jgi:four helix bundle protein|nr:four helix bundle protein [Bacteroidales bacterium]
MAKSILKDKSFLFAIECIELYKFLTETKKEFVMSKQFLKSSISVGANIRENQNAESSMDLIHKLAITQKECYEKTYWLELLKAKNYIESDVFTKHNYNATEILKMIRSSILTKKNNLKNKS